MEVHQLRYAVAVADHGTFTAAARACFVSQPSLSLAVRGLEAELGSELFHRLGRHTTLTSAGEAFIPAAREVLRGLDTVRAAVHQVAGIDAGHLDLVALPTLAVDPIAPLVGAFRTAHPNVTVRLAHPEGTRALADAVQSGRSEVGVTELPVTVGDRLRTVPLGRQELVVVLPPDGPRPRTLTLPALARLPVVSQPRGTSTRDAIDAALATIGAEPIVVVETDQREAIIPLVLAGAGAAVVPRPMARAARRDGAAVAPLRPGLWRQLGLVHRPAPLSPAAAAFVTLATDVGSRPPV